MHPEKAVIQSDLNSNLWIISAPYEGGYIEKNALSIFCKKMRTHFDVIIIDTAAGLGAPLQSAVSVCTEAIIVITPDPVTMRDGRIVSDYIFNNGKTNIKLVINKVTNNIVKKGLIKNLDECIDVVCAQLLGVVPFSDEILSASCNGCGLEINSKEYKIFNNIALRIYDEYVPLEIM